MSFYYVAVILGFSIVIPAAIGLIRFSKIDTAYQPFIIYCVLDVLNHTLSTWLIEVFHSNTINSNIFVLIEAMLYLFVFRRWGTFKKRNSVFYSTLIILCLVWIVDNLIWHQLNTVNSLFRIVYSFILVFLSIEQMNVLISTAKKNLLYNACFMICSGIVIYYSYKATIEVFFLIQLKGSVSFYVNIFKILVFVNLFANLLFAWSILWIPKKPRFILQH
jgi:hypothetical protein